MRPARADGAAAAGDAGTEAAINTVATATATPRIVNAAPTRRQAGTAVTVARTTITLKGLSARYLRVKPSRDPFLITTRGD
ncbi:alpha/beta hydrolase fold protein, precursor [Mycolicibacterium thermoresistibile]|uniref:Alpha/beta hydrolase fold protein n=1 Tax=Mycolicibacterium thermoresistibile TaxID=1797 RepID=A0A100XAN5_MYCTH|nr:alpha/beta hydrolase fold protein, precursor [Mycolicibacterium thermoresistibile]